MSITALIAEDEPLLAEHLERELQKLWPQLTIVANLRNGVAALETGLKEKVDILFLDISMPLLNGLEVVEALAEEWPLESKAFPMIVFVTAFDQYAVQAFEKAALDYLIKPLKSERLMQTCQRLQQALAQKTPVPTTTTLEQLAGLFKAVPSAHQSYLKNLQASSGNSVYFVAIADVLYIEAVDKYLKVVTAEREYFIRATLRELKAQLDPEQFWQIHRSTLVQVNAVERATRQESGTLIIHLRQHADQLKVSRLYAHLFSGR